MRRQSFLLMMGLLLACSQHQPVRIGAKDFVEQQVVAEMVSRVLKDDGFAVEAVVSCGDTYACYAALRGGDLDLMVDYTGTGFVFRGDVPVRGDKAIGALNELYESMGLTWLTPLGFDNSYVLVVRGDDARQAGLNTVSGWAQSAQELRIVCPREFLRRPLDGLQSLVARYGFRLLGGPMVEDDPHARVSRLLDGEADVAILYGTDGAALDSRVLVLEDDLDFFPAYDAVTLANTGALKRFTGLESSLARLTGRVSLNAMRRLNRRVQLEGASPAVVAGEFLVSEQLLSNPDAIVARAPELVIAVDPEAGLSRFEDRALAAVRKAWPRRQVALMETSEPVVKTVDGEARLGLVGGERFFDANGREERVEAVVAIGARRVHTVCRVGHKMGSKTVAGVGAGSSDRATLEPLVRMAGLTVATADSADGALARLLDGQTDCAVLLAEVGSPAIGEAIASGAVELLELPVSLADVRRVAPYFRPARIPAQTYVGQTTVVETVSSQVLLVGPRREGGLEATGGPATAMPAPGQPVGAARVQALAASAEYHEAPDPILPSAWEHSLPQRTTGRSAGGAGDAILNGLVFLFLGWLVYLVFRRERSY